jgi:hypothetical protein
MSSIVLIPFENNPTASSVKKHTQNGLWIQPETSMLIPIFFPLTLSEWRVV